MLAALYVPFVEVCICVDYNAGKIKGPGLLFPLTQDVYGPILEELRASSKSWATWTKSSQDID